MNINIMKKFFSFICFLLTMTVAAKANPVSVQQACTIGTKFLKVNTDMKMASTHDLQIAATYRTSNGATAFYIFNARDGFVIVSADDCATPILGYSDEGQFDVENIPIQLQDYLQGFVDQIEYSIENHLEANENIARQWELVKVTGRLNENHDDEVVEPLITALWSQRCYYNAMCPEDPDGPCGHVLTGCAATALGMILHYWGYPAHGTGSHTYTPIPYPTTQYPEQSVNFGETTYDWDNMPVQLTDTSTQAEIDAVATLLWHCGVAMDMSYSPYGSGTEGHFSVLTDYFDYSDDMHWETREDDESWMSLLKADLDLGRPIFYTGYRWATSGHAFVCDGYDVNDRFHFNWGWNGSSNGYFALDATMTFIYNNDAIFNIHPNVGTTYQTTELSSGWNWWSTNLDITLDQLKEALVNAFRNTDATITIKSQTQSTSYNDSIWRGQLSEISVGQMYEVYSPASGTITLAGTPVDQIKLTIKNGSNWIALPLSESMNPTEVFGLFPVTGDIIKSKEGRASYNGTMWRGTLQNLEPGQGYIYKSNAQNDRTFTFPTSAK